jgi:hypothetical protein
MFLLRTGCRPWPFYACLPSRWDYKVCHFTWVFVWVEILVTFLPRLALNHNPPDLYLPSSWTVLPFCHSWIHIFNGTVISHLKYIIHCIVLVIGKLFISTSFQNYQLFEGRINAFTFLFVWVFQFLNWFDTEKCCLNIEMYWY